MRKGTIAKNIIKALAKANGITAEVSDFYSAKAWKDRCENYGTNSELVIVHEGELQYLFDPCVCPGLFDKLQSELNKVGLFAEACTGWYSAIYEN